MCCTHLDSDDGEAHHSLVRQLLALPGHFVGPQVAVAHTQSPQGVAGKGLDDLLELRLLRNGPTRFV
jgi:hypothetical protein